MLHETLDVFQSGVGLVTQPCCQFGLAIKTQTILPPARNEM